MIGSQKIIVEVEGTKVNIEGRRYETSHVLLVSSSSASVSVDSNGIYIKAEYNELPTVDMVGGDLVKIIGKNGRYVVDTMGDTIKEYKVYGNKIKIRGDVISIKFSQDDGKITVVIPRHGTIKSEKLDIKTKKPTSINVIVHPFVTGVISIHGEADIEIESKASPRLVVKA